MSKNTEGSAPQKIAPGHHFERMPSGGEALVADERCGCGKFPAKLSRWTGKASDGTRLEVERSPNGDVYISSTTPGGALDMVTLTADQWDAAVAAVPPRDKADTWPVEASSPASLLRKASELAKRAEPSVRGRRNRARLRSARHTMEGLARDHLSALDQETPPNA